MVVLSGRYGQDVSFVSRRLTQWKGKYRFPTSEKYLEGYSQCESFPEFPQGTLLDRLDVPVKTIMDGVWIFNMKGSGED